MPGFFDTFTPAPAGLSYIGKEERAELIAAGATLTFTRVIKGPDQYNPGKSRYLCVVSVEGEERGLNFGEGVGSRDAMLEALMVYLDGDDATPVDLRIEMAGRAQILVEA